MAIQAGKFQEQKLVLLRADLAGYARATANLDALAVAAFMDDWYACCASVVRSHGGRVVKFIGDACLATFADDQPVAAVDTAVAVRTAVDAIRAKHRVKVDAGVNVHSAVVAAGMFGPGDEARYDVLGSGVNHLFMMGGGSGIRISEPVFRGLPNDRRSTWAKHRPPATYALT